MRSLVLFAAAWALLGVPPQEQRPTFRASADLVAVEVSVRERTRVVANLKAEDFELLDNGVRQDVFDLSYGKLPIDMTVALDISYSVTGSLLDRLRRAIRQLMADLGPRDRLRLVLFNMRVRRVVDYTTDVTAIEQAIASVTAGGGTSILDAISVGLVSAEHGERRQLVVFFSDGADALSTTTPDVLLDVAARSAASLTLVLPASMTGVGFVRSGGRGPAAAPTPQSARQSRQAALYRRLAADTGGVVIPMVLPNQDLSELFARALEEFRSTYVLHFAPRGVKPGGFHTLQVDVPGRKGLTIRARRGYWGE